MPVRNVKSGPKKKHKHDYHPVRKQKRELATVINPFSSTQVLHSERMITNLDDLEYGVTYRLHDLRGEFKVTFDYDFIKDGNHYLVDTSGANYHIADLGLIPYSDGNWNAINWLEELD